MNRISSKFLSLKNVEGFINALSYENKKLDGILLLTSFGIVFGKFYEVKELSDSNSISDILMNSQNETFNTLKSEGFEIFGDGSTIILKDAYVKYSYGIVLNMDEVIIFCDQIIGFYPVDLDKFSSFHK